MGQSVAPGVTMGIGSPAQFNAFTANAGCAFQQKRTPRIAGR